MVTMRVVLVTWRRWQKVLALCSLVPNHISLQQVETLAIIPLRALDPEVGVQ